MILKTRIKSVTTLATSSYIQETTYSTPTESKKREAQYSSPLTHSLLFLQNTYYLPYLHLAFHTQEGKMSKISDNPFATTLEKDYLQQVKSF